MKHSNEAMWWSLFSAGGVLSALFVPALIISTGLILPFVGQTTEDAPSLQGIHDLVSNWLVRLPLLAVITFSFFHCLHRVRHILLDLGLRGAPALLSVVCYGGAVVGTGIAAWIIFSL